MTTLTTYVPPRIDYDPYKVDLDDLLVYSDWLEDQEREGEARFVRNLVRYFEYIKPLNKNPNIPEISDCVWDFDFSGNRSLDKIFPQHSRLPIELYPYMGAKASYHNTDGFSSLYYESINDAWIELAMAYFSLNNLEWMEL